MSNMFNLVFGGDTNESGILFFMLGLTQGDCGRYRSIYVTESHICVYTRNGGGNRDAYEDVFDKLSEHPLYDFDEDDDFDCTYATIYFKHPEKYTEQLKELSLGTITPSEKWEALIKSLHG